MSAQIAKKNINIFEYGISYIERSKNEGKKITFIDGILSYIYLFRARFIQNNIHTNFSVLYSSVTLTYVGSFFGMGTGKILITILFALMGMMLGLKRKIIPISLILLCIYIGSLFSKGNGRIFPILVLLIFSIYISKKITQKYSKINKNYFLKFLI